MRSYLLFVGVMIVGCSLFQFSKVMHQANRRLTPEQLALLVASRENSWSDFLLPTLPIIVAFIALSIRPALGGWVAIPAIVVSAIIIGLQMRSASRRMNELDLPESFLRSKRNASLLLVVGMAVGFALIVAGTAVRYAS
jgi:hypothetical protein